jgi:hypothetical protein
MHRRPGATSWAATSVRRWMLGSSENDARFSGRRDRATASPAASRRRRGPHSNSRRGHVAPESCSPLGTRRTSHHQFRQVRMKAA